MVFALVTFGFMCMTVAQTFPRTKRMIYSEITKTVTVTWQDSADWVYDHITNIPDCEVVCLMQSP
ncbi:unnamed protein product [Ixodes pacificus]